MKNKTVKLPLVIVALAILGWLFRPYLHGLVMYFYIRPLLIIFFILSASFSIWIYLRLRKNIQVTTTDGTSKGKTRSWPWILILICLLVFFIIPEWFFPAVAISAVFYFYRRSRGDFKWKAKTLSPRSALLFSAVLTFVVLFVFFAILESEFHYLMTIKNIDFESRDSFPQVEPIRIQPKIVATRFATDSLQNPQERLGDSQIALVDGKLKRVFPRLPDGAILYYIQKLTGFITIDVSSLKREATNEDQQFEYAEGIGIFDNIYFQLPLKKFFVTYAEQPIYLKDPETKEWVTVVPYISYKYFPIRVPVWGGFMTVSSDGTITDHKPEEAENLALTRGNRVYPKELARYYAESFAYKEGIFNNWFLHKGQTEIDETEDEPQPFHIATTEGFKQVIFTKPVGSSYGIFKIFIFDATSGKREIIEFNQKSLLSGPVASIEYSRRGFPTIDYNLFSIAEPRPIMVNNELYWFLSIVNKTGSGIAKTVVVNAKTNNFVGFDTEEELKTFIVSGSLPTSAEVRGMKTDR